MTCIIGVVEGAQVWVGGDSALSNMSTHEIVTAANQKVFRVGDLLLGVSGSPRVCDVLRYSLEPPRHPKRMEAGRYIRTLFMDAMRDTLKKAGVLRVQAGIEDCDANILIGYRGRLFTVEDDFHAHETVDDYVSIGSGSAVANGALSVSQGVAPRKRVIAALAASERYTASVRRPFYVLTLEGKA